MKLKIERRDESKLKAIAVIFEIAGFWSKDKKSLFFTRNFLDKCESLIAILVQEIKPEVLETK